MFLHLVDAAKDNDSSSFMIRTNDTDVVVLAIALSSRYNLQIYVSFGTGTNYRYINAYDIALTLGCDKSKALLLLQFSCLHRM